MRPGRCPVEQSLLLHQLLALRCARQSTVFHFDREPRHRSLYPRVPRPRTAVGRCAQRPIAPPHTGDLRYARPTRRTSESAGIADAEIFRNTAATWYTGSGAAAAAAQLAWRAARCGVPGARWGVSNWIIDERLWLITTDMWLVVCRNARPGSSSVSEKFRVDWGTYMSSRNDVIYIRLDVRGAKGQSKRALYRHLGGVEVQDQIAVLRYFAIFVFVQYVICSYLLCSSINAQISVGNPELPGWNSGGSLGLGLRWIRYIDGPGNPAKCLQVWHFSVAYYRLVVLQYVHSNHTFRIQVVLKILNSIDSAFTERVLGFPNENYKGYVEADATQRARHIPSYSYFLLHGLADKSAPYLHGTQMARALTEAGVIFQYQVGEILHSRVILMTEEEMICFADLCRRGSWARERNRTRVPLDGALFARLSQLGLGRNEAVAQRIGL